MVWPIYELVTYGICNPAGEYIRDRDAIDAYYSAEMRDAEIRVLGLEKSFKDHQDMGIAYKFMSALATKKFTKNLGPLKDVECPKTLRLDKTPKKLGALIMSGLPAVSETLKDIIEGLEPGVHQFWPLTIELPSKKTWPEQYYGMRIATFLDSFRPEQSKDGSYRPHAGVFRSRDNKGCTTGLAFAGDVFAGKHIWREVNLNKPQMCMSDALQAAVAEKELYLPPHWQAMEV